MSDRELLELAAKAAGHEVWTDIDGTLYTGEPERNWNPLTDDGDALRLAVKLNIQVLRFERITTARPLLRDFSCVERDDGDAYAATRRAIVRAAAEIGKDMP